MTEESLSFIENLPRGEIENIINFLCFSSLGMYTAMKSVIPDEAWEMLEGISEECENASEEFLLETISNLVGREEYFELWLIFKYLETNSDERIGLFNDGFRTVMQERENSEESCEDFFFLLDVIILEQEMGNYYGALMMSGTFLLNVTYFSELFQEEIMKEFREHIGNMVTFLVTEIKVNPKEHLALYQRWNRWVKNAKLPKNDPGREALDFISKILRPV